MDENNKAPDRARSEAAALPSGAYAERDPVTGETRISIHIRPDDLVLEKVEGGDEIYSIRGWGNHNRI